jgi:hypothetical protein
MADDKTVDGVRQQFAEQIDFFRRKLNLASHGSTFSVRA